MTSLKSELKASTSERAQGGMETSLRRRAAEREAFAIASSGEAIFSSAAGARWEDGWVVVRILGSERARQGVIVGVCETLSGRLGARSG